MKQHIRSSASILDLLENRISELVIQFVEKAMVLNASIKIDQTGKFVFSVDVVADDGVASRRDMYDMSAGVENYASYFNNSAELIGHPIKRLDLRMAFTTLRYLLNQNNIVYKLLRNQSTVDVITFYSHELNNYLVTKLSLNGNMITIMPKRIVENDLFTLVNLHIHNIDFVRRIYHSQTNNIHDAFKSMVLIFRLLVLLIGAFAGVLPIVSSIYSFNGNVFIIILGISIIFTTFIVSILFPNIVARLFRRRVFPS